MFSGNVKEKLGKGFNLYNVILRLCLTLKDYENYRTLNFSEISKKKTQSTFISILDDFSKEMGSPIISQE